MEILFEDNDIIVCKKPVGVSSEFSEVFINMPQLLRNHLNDSKHYIGVVHRLDAIVGGVMVYAKNKNAAAELSHQIQNGVFEKFYLTVVNGIPENTTGTYCDILFKDSKNNKSFVVKTERKGVKRAVLHYTVIDTKTHNSEPVSLLKIKLDTGRSHQIRVQLSSRKMSILGDGKYGSREKCNIALFSTEIKFFHPVTCAPLHFSELPDNKFPFNLFCI